VAVVALGGCGGSAPTHSTPHFAAIASTICGDAASALHRLPARAPSLVVLIAAARRELAITRAEYSQLAALRPPTVLARRFVAALSAGRAETATIGQLIAALHGGSQLRVAELAERARSVDTRARRTIAALGLAQCTRAAAPRGG